MYKIIGSDQKEYGPISADQLRQWIAEGRINAQTLIQSETDPSWRPLASFPEFAASAASSPAPFMPPMGGMDMRARAASLVKGPAITMIVIAALGIPLDILGALGNLVGVSQSRFQNPDPEMQRVMDASRGPAAVVVCLICILMCIFLIFCATRMLKLQNYGLCIAASIIIMLPCTYPCCCIFGIPAGIWALVVLNKPEVKSSFT